MKRNKYFIAVLLNIISMVNIVFAESNVTESGINTNELITEKFESNSILIVGIIVLILIIYIIKNKIFYKSKLPKTTIITESTIQKILDINELSTIEYPFESIAVVYKEDKREDKN